MTYRLCQQILFIRFGQTSAGTYYLALEISVCQKFRFTQKSKMVASAITANYKIVNNLKNIKVRDTFVAPTGELYELLCHRKRKREKRTPQNESFWNNSDPVHLIWTEFGMDILLDHRKTPAEEFLIFLKIQEGHRRSKVQNRPNLTPQITFRLCMWIRFIRFGQ